MDNINLSSFQVICKEFFTELQPFGHGFEDLNGNFTEGITPGNTKDKKSSNKTPFEDALDLDNELREVNEEFQSAFKGKGPNHLSL